MLLRSDATMVAQSMLGCAAPGSCHEKAALRLLAVRARAAEGLRRGAGEPAEARVFGRAFGSLSSQLVARCID